MTIDNNSTFSLLKEIQKIDEIELILQL